MRTGRAGRPCDSRRDREAQPTAVEELTRSLLESGSAGQTRRSKYQRNINFLTKQQWLDGFSVRRERSWVAPARVSL